MGLLTPRDVPRAVAERSEAEWSRPEGHPSLSWEVYTILFNLVLSISYSLYKWQSVTTLEYPYSSQCNFHWGEYGNVFFILTPATRVSMKNTLSYSPW